MLNSGDFTRYVVNRDNRRMRPGTRVLGMDCLELEWSTRFCGSLLLLLLLSHVGPTGDLLRSILLSISPGDGSTGRNTRTVTGQGGGTSEPAQPGTLPRASPSPTHSTCLSHYSPPRSTDRHMCCTLPARSCSSWVPLHPCTVPTHRNG